MKKYYYILTFGLAIAFLLAIGWNFNDATIAQLKAHYTAYSFKGIFISLGVLLFCLVLETFFLPFKESSIYKIFHPNKSIVTDLVIGFTYTLGVFFFVKTIFLTGLGDAAFTEVKIPKLVEPSAFTWKYIPALLMFIVLADFLKYVFHRLCHEISFLWEIHKYHHASTDFILLTGNRVHPIEHILQKIFVSIPLIALGIKVDMYIAVIIFSLFIDKLQHSMLHWNYGFIGKYFIYAPIGHRIHHSKEIEHWDKNYGDLFVFWDRLFGTYYKGKHVNKEVGVTENWMNQEGIIYDLWHSMYLSILSLKKSITTWSWRAAHLKKDKLDD